MAHIEKSIEVNVPVTVAYNQWTQFEEFPKFMDGVEDIQQLDDRRLHWKAIIGGKTVEWDAEIVEQTPDSRIAWRNITGAYNAGQVSFQPVGNDRCRVDLRLDYQPEGFVESTGDALGFVSRQVEGDLNRFKEFIESQQHETGAWRGEIHSGTSIPVAEPSIPNAAAVPASFDVGRSSASAVPVGGGAAEAYATDRTDVSNMNAVGKERGGAPEYGIDQAPIQTAPMASAPGSPSGLSPDYSPQGVAGEGEVDQELLLSADQDAGILGTPTPPDETAGRAGILREDATSLNRPAEPLDSTRATEPGGSGTTETSDARPRQTDV